MKFILDRQNSDLVASEKGKIHNLGYNYFGRLPIMFWLAHMQNTGENLFKPKRFNFKKREIHRSSSEKLEERIDAAIKLSGKIPLPLEEFNIQVRLKYLSEFTAGNNQRIYTFEVDPERNLRLIYSDRRMPDGQKEGIQMIIPPEDFENVMASYIKFALQETPYRWFGRDGDIIQTIVRLRNPQDHDYQEEW